MADKSTLEQMLEHLVNDETAKAEELFHEYVVAKSREIYEDLIEEEVKDEEVEEASAEKKEDEAVDEASKDKDKEEEKVDEASDEDSKDEEVDEEFEEVAVEGDDEAKGDDAMGGDATDDLAADITKDSEEGEKEPEELFQDLDAIVDELQAKFDEIKGVGDAEAKGDDMEDEMKDSIQAPIAADPQGDAELATMREYVEKITGGHGAEKKGAGEGADNTKSPVAGKNDMGGTTANIAKGGEAKEKNDGGLSEIKPKDMDSGNVNVPGAKKAADLSAVKGGHGAEKAGAKEQADNKQSIFRGRR
jgi:hypothetical protein